MRASGCVDRIGVHAVVEDCGVMACCVLAWRFSMAYTVADRSAFTYVVSGCICIF